ncbi:MAG: hypothetical protein ACOYLK_13525 [Sphingomonas sp.]
MAILTPSKGGSFFGTFLRWITGDDWVMGWALACGLSKSSDAKAAICPDEMVLQQATNSRLSAAGA